MKTHRIGTRCSGIGTSFLHISKHQIHSNKPISYFSGLMLYGLREDPENPETEDTLNNDPDICLISNIVQKVILPKITGI